MSSSPHVICSWCHDTALEDTIVSLFIDNAQANYISHSELQIARADAPGKWHPGLPASLLQDVRDALSTSPETHHYRLAVAHVDAQLAGFAFISIDTRKEASRPFATIDDMVISPHMRGAGVGHNLLEWITRELQQCGIARLFLESGIDNAAAHTFFHKHGFHTVSVVMMKDI